MEKENVVDQYFINPDGLKLFRLVYENTTQPLKAVVFICHGLFEHCQNSYYEPIISPLNQEGCLVITHDHQGHGLSEGSRGMVYDIQYLTRDVLLDLDEIIKVKNIDSSIPKFLYGYSLGCQVSIYATLQRNNFFSGIFLEAPALKPTTTFCDKPLFIVNLLGRLFPTKLMGRLDLDCMCQDPEKIIQMQNDKLMNHDAVPALTCKSTFNIVPNLKNVTSRVNTPFIIVQGEADPFCAMEGCKILMENSKTTDKKLVTFPNAKHTLRIEINGVKEKVSEEVVGWIRAKINS